MLLENHLHRFTNIRNSFPKIHQRTFPLVSEIFRASIWEFGVLHFRRWRGGISGLHSIHSILNYSFLNLQESDRQPKIGPPTTGSTVPGTIPSFANVCCSHSGRYRNHSTFLGKSQKPCMMKILEKVSYFWVSEKSPGGLFVQ